MNSQETLCGVVFDAMSLKQGIYYNITTNSRDGHEDLGEYGKSEKTAQYVMVFMAKGLKSKWKQVLGYFFLFLS